MIRQPALPANALMLHMPALSVASLPAQPTPLLGRDPEVAAIQERLVDPAVRLLTLTGPGGTGKTRLAVAAAAGLVDHVPHGVVFVDLVPVRHATRVPAAIAQALDVRQSGTESALAALVAAMHQHQLLLVLDNFEQVLAAAVDLVELLAACPSLTLLVTSRAPLRVRWEQEYPVLPLAVPALRPDPDLSALAANPAVALFVQWARAVRPDFALREDNARDVAAICTHLAGLPLAIELAAARVRILSPQALLSRLVEGTGASALQILSGGARDLPERQRSLRDTIAWSYDLLSPAERTVFRRLAVFAGGCTLEAAEAVCGGALSDGDSGFRAGAVLEGLASLVEQSLVVQHDGPNGESRFGMLETVHEFSREQLASSGEHESLCGRHAAHLLQFAQAAAQALLGSAQAEWLQQLEAEHHNLRTALAWALACGEGDMALRLCETLYMFWYLNGHYREARDWIARALAAAPQSAPATRAAVFYGAALIADIQQDDDDARRLIDASVELWRSTGIGSRLVGALALQGLTARHRGDTAMARAACEEALAINAKHPDRSGHRLALSTLGFLAESDGDRATARGLLEESLRVARESGSPVEMALQLNNLGIIALRQGDLDEAARFYLEGLRLSSGVAAFEFIAGSLDGLAGVAAARGRPRRAALLLGAATALRAEIGGPRVAQFEEEYQRVAPAVQEALGAAAFAAGTAEGAAVPLAEMIALALANDDAADFPPVSMAGDGPHAPPVPTAGAPSPPPARWPVPPSALTERQVEYLRLLARGHTNKEIAAALVVSEIAVERMLDRLYDRIRVRNRAAAIRYTLDHALDQPHAR